MMISEKGKVFLVSIYRGHAENEAGELSQHHTKKTCNPMWKSLNFRYIISQQRLVSRNWYNLEFFLFYRKLKVAMIHILSVAFINFTSICCKFGCRSMLMPQEF